MKKSLLLLLSIFLFKCGFAQELSWEQKYNAIRAIDSVLKIYSENIAFTDNSSDSISDKSMKRFRNVFASDATVFDDLNPSFFDGNMQDKMKFKERSVEEFLAKTKETYPLGLLSANVTNMRISYNSLNFHAAFASIEKEVIAVTRNNWRIRMKDTLLITFKLSEDYRTAKIQKISQDGAVYDVVKYELQNDRDHDFVIDDEDRCKDIPGFIQYEGCEPPTGPFATLLVSGGLGYSKENFGGSEGDILNEGKYDDYNVNITRTNQLLDPDLNGSLELELFPWRERQLGIGFGATYSFTNATLVINPGEYDVVYKSNIFQTTGIDKLGRDYRRFIENTTEITENVNFNYITPFVNLKYKSQFRNSKIGFKLNVGIGYSVTLGSPKIGNLNGTFSYGAAYSYLGNDEWGYSKNPTTYEIVFTEDYMNTYGDSSEKLLNDIGALNYDVGTVPINQVTADKEVDLGFGYAFIVTPAITYQTFSSLYWNFGIQFMYSNHDNKSFDPKTFVLTDSKEDYTTLLQSTKRVEHIYFGITAGVSFSLAKKFDKANQY